MASLACELMESLHDAVVGMNAADSRTGAEVETLCIDSDVAEAAGRKSEREIESEEDADVNLEVPRGKMEDGDGGDGREPRIGDRSRETVHASKVFRGGGDGTEEVRHALLLDDRHDVGGRDVCSCIITTRSAQSVKEGDGGGGCVVKRGRDIEGGNAAGVIRLLSRQSWYACAN